MLVPVELDPAGTARTRRTSRAERAASAFDRHRKGTRALSGLEILLNIAGGAALLLWATRMVRTGITRAFGAELRRVLGRSTKNPLAALAMGLGIAGLLQSATATALLTVSFAGRGLIAIGAGLAVMLGADVGSTLVVQVLSFDISWLSPVFLLAGVVSFLSSDRPIRRHLGRVAIGLGLLLMSLTLIVGASESLRGSETLAAVVAPLTNEPLLAVLLAALLTWLAHSSVAMVLLFMSFTVAGVIPPLLGFALVLGANIGSGIVPVVLTASAAPLGRRIPLGNLLFRAVGALLVLPILSFLPPWIEALSSDPARQIANFHTAFNLALALVCLPLTGVVAALMARLLPEGAKAADATRPKYLDPSATDKPSLALAAATREVLRMAEVVEVMLRDVMEVFRNDDARLLKATSGRDDEVDRLNEAIKLYLAKVSRNALNEADSRRCIELITFTTNLEHIGDIIDKNLLETGQKKIKKKLAFSKAGWKELSGMHARLVDQMQLAMNVFVSGDVHIARQLIAQKERFRELERSSSELHLERLSGGQVESIESSALHLDILRDLKRINSHLTSVAYPILDAEGELRPSRLVVPAEPPGEEAEDPAPPARAEDRGKAPGR
jgi:phosphate:Na+ symporter